MKNRRLEIGKAVKLANKTKRAPPEFERWLCEAVKEGSEFAPQFIELFPRALHKAYLEKLESFHALSRRNPAVVNSLVAMFNYSLSRTILDNRDEEKWLIRQGLKCSVEAQNRIAAALLWLAPGDRTTLLNVWQKAGLNYRDWQYYCQGSMAVARFAYAAIKCGVSTRIAESNHDIHRKIDLFCEPPFQGSPTLCVQIKSHIHAEGATLKILQSPPDPDGLSPEEYKNLNGVWRGVQEFNREYRRKWVPVFVRVGMSGVPPNRLYDSLIERDLERFFSSIAERSIKTENNPFDPDCRTTDACA
jgi:hypothetical protein